MRHKPKSTDPYTHKSLIPMSNTQPLFRIFYLPFWSYDIIDFSSHFYLFLNIFCFSLFLFCFNFILFIFILLLFLFFFSTFVANIPCQLAYFVLRTLHSVLFDIRCSLHVVTVIEIHLHTSHQSMPRRGRQGEKSKEQPTKII